MTYTPSLDRYKQMKYNRCGKSGLLLPAISLGLWHNFGDKDDFKTAVEIIDFAFDNGITHFDLANNYGPEPGAAETNFGRILKEYLSNYRDEMIISTKAGYYMWDGPYGEWGSKKYLVSSLDQSLKRMKLDYVDIFYSHRYDPKTPLEETMYTLDLLVKQGKALYVGVSNYTAEQTRNAFEILKGQNTPFVIHQPRYSMFDRWIESNLLNLLDDAGIGCICYSPLAQGLLTNRYLNGVPDDSRIKKNVGFLTKKHLTEKVLNQVKKLSLIAQNRGQSLAQMALSWILKDNRITSVLVGASSVSQLNDSLQSLNNLSFSTDELEKIDEILK